MTSFPGWPPTWATILLLPALFVAFTVHELAHAIVAYLLGDTSQVERRRLSFNPLRHVSWLGMVAFLLVGFGWARPVWVDYQRFRIRNRALGVFLVAVAGAVSNLLFALLVLFGMWATMVVFGVVSEAPPYTAFRFLWAQNPGPDLRGAAVALTSYMFNVNLVLAFFNLLPIPPLDGFTAMMSLFSLIRDALKRRSVPEAADRPMPKPVTWSSGVSPAQIHFDIALDYHRHDQLDEAIARYRQAIDQDHDFALAYYDLGLAYAAKGRLALATSAFRSAIRSTRDSGLRGQAELRLRALAQVGQQPGASVDVLPPPLDGLSQVPIPSGVAPTLDPVVARRVWLRLAVGAAVLAVLSVLVWLFVTAVTLIEVG